MFMKNGKLPWCFAATILSLALATAGCDSTAKRQWLTVFFDGVPGPVTGTNVVAATTNLTGENVPVAPEKPAPAPPPSTFSSHPPFLQQNCTACHASASGMGLKAPPPELCWNCHKDFLAGQKVKHQPVESGDCTSCHEPHQSENKHLLVKKGTELCLSCHDDPLAAGKVKHQAVEDGECLDCHAPHATNFKGLLKKSVKDTCADCHDDVPAKNQKDVHQPVSDGDCLACHAPHAGKIKGLLKKSAPTLCWDCHDNFLEKAKFKHDVVEDCTGCHKPHASSENFLLAKNILKLCGDCHDDKDLKADKGHAGAEGKSCVACHDPHAGQNVNLLKPSALPK
jgi:predicted CXXCH cytochrome family protein